MIRLLRRIFGRHPKTPAAVARARLNVDTKGYRRAVDEQYRQTHAALREWTKGRGSKNAR